MSLGIAVGVLLQLLTGLGLGAPEGCDEGGDV